MNLPIWLRSRAWLAERAAWQRYTHYRDLLDLATRAAEPEAILARRQDLADACRAEWLARLADTRKEVPTTNALPLSRENP